MNEKKTVLVVDDIPLMRTMLAKYLQALGGKLFEDSGERVAIHVLEAPNGKIALELLQEHPVDLILLDLMMPVMDGLTFLEFLRSQPEYESIPVIVCTALDEVAAISRAKELGAAAYITKPFTLRALEEKFREAILAHFK